MFHAQEQTALLEVSPECMQWRQEMAHAQGGGEIWEELAAGEVTSQSDCQLADADDKVKL